MKRYWKHILSLILAGTGIVCLAQVPASFIRSGLIFGNGAQAQAGGVIGVANFSLSGSVGNLHVGGVVTNITRTNTGRFTITMTGSTNFSIALAATETGSGASIFITGSPNFAASTTSIDCVILNGDGSQFVDSPQVAVTITQL